MRLFGLSGTRLPVVVVVGSLLAGCSSGPDQTQSSATATAKAPACLDSGASGLKLPAGFCATLFADNIGHARHLVASPSGAVYVNTWSGKYYPPDALPPAGGFLVALKDQSGSGKADAIQRFGESVQSGGTGGTGIALYNGSLYAEINDRIVRYSLPAGQLVPQEPPVTVVSGLPLTGDHPMHPFVVGEDGFLYIDVGTASNSCQVKNRKLKSPGASPCTELKTRGGIWRYDANKTNQAFSPAERYATGIRNGEGFAVDTIRHRMFVTQHGRDQLHTMWPALYADEQEATLPAEEVLLLQQGGDYGWPECYYDPVRNSLVLAPEYGGDGGKKVGPCAGKLGPFAAFPAHWAPMALAIYDQKQFPARYQNGLFIAFHGSWNRAPFAQQGYNVVFQSLAGDQSSGSCEIFADGFAGAEKNPEKAAHRPSGLAVGPAGELYIADDVAGRVYKIVYQGDPGQKDADVTPCPSLTASAGPVVTAVAGPAETTSSVDVAKLPVPEGATREMVTLGSRLYRDQVGTATCIGCHGANATGTPLGPDLTDKTWLWNDGSYSAITKTITEGVPTPKQYRSAMPPMAGSQLNAGQISALAAYVWALSHTDK